MKQGNENDKKMFGDLYAKLEGIKGDLKHSHSLDILQSIITRYNSACVMSAEVVRYCAAEPKAQKKLNNLESRVDQLIFDALYKELEAMKHELKHCNSLEQLDTLKDHHKKINTTENAVIRHIGKHHSAQEKILKLEKKVADQLISKRKEFAVVRFDLGSHSSEKAIDNTKLKEPVNQSDSGNAVVDMAPSIEAVDLITQQPPASPAPDAFILEVPQVPAMDTSATIKDVEESNPATEDPVNMQSLLLQQRNMRESQLASFDKIVKQLASKRDDFHLRYPKDSCYDMTKAYGASYQLVKTLSGLSESYKEGAIAPNVFKAQATQVIQGQRKGVLSEHRGCKELLANLLLAIGTLGIGYALAALYTQSFMPIKLNTQSANCLDQALQSVEQYDNAMKNRL